MKVDNELVDPGTKLSPIRHNEEGEELLDTTKRQPPLGHKKTVPLHLQIRQAVRLQKILDDEAVGETMEEAEDFEVGDDFEPLSPYEQDHIPDLKTLKAHAQAINDEIKKAQRAAAAKDYEETVRRQQQTSPSKKGSEVNPGAGPSPPQGAGEDLG